MRALFILARARANKNPLNCKSRVGMQNGEGIEWIEGVRDLSVKTEREERTGVEN